MIDATRRKGRTGIVGAQGDEPMVTHRYAIENVAEAVRMADAGECQKALIESEGSAT